MKKMFQQSVSMALLGVLFVVMWGCSPPIETPPPAEKPLEKVETPVFSVEDVVFHAGTESFIVPQNDPYTLANFQKAYEMLASGNSAQALTRSQIDEFSSTTQLEATHYSLKIYPENESEQWEIELLEDVNISYIPFDYVQLPDEAVENIFHITRSDIPTYSEESHYSVIYDDLETVVGSIEPETYVMPIMYAVWPINKPLPERRV